MEPKRSTLAPDTSCPRCGYDQNGVIDTWRESCSLAGTCSECGLEYQWAEVLSPSKRTPGWYVETIRFFPWCWLNTMLRAAFPPCLWKRVPLGAVYNLRRLVLCIACAYVVAHTLVLAFVLTAEYTSWFGGSADYIVQFKRRVPGVRGRWVRGTVVANLWKAILWPPVAINHYCKGTGVWWSARHASPMPYVCATACVLVPLCFALLPQTLDSYKIRARHIVRIALLGASVALLYAGASSTASGVLATTRGFMPLWMLLPLSGLPFVLWSVWFWWSAARHYLRLPHALAVSILLHVIACIVVLLIPPVTQYIMHNFVLTGY